MFKAYFEDLEDIGDVDTIVRVGTEAGLPAAELREALVSGQYRNEVDDGIRWSQEVGVTAVPTFVLGGEHGIAGAQESAVFEDLLLRKFGVTPRG